MLFRSIKSKLLRVKRLFVSKSGNVRTPLRNNAGGHANHSLFWQILKTGTTLQGKLKAAIERDFGSVEAFQAEFEKAAATRFGSG